MIRNHILLVLAFSLLLGTSHALYGQDTLTSGRYTLHRSQYQDGFVNGMNVQSFIDTHIPGFTFTGSHTSLNRGIAHHYVRKSDNAILTIWVGVYPSVSDAEEKMLELLNSSSLAMEYGPVLEHQIGDNCWWYAGPPFPLRIVSFIRKNSIVYLNTNLSEENCYEGLLDLALALDQDMMKGASYIPLAHIPDPPVITSVTTTATQLRENEHAKVTVTASDPDGNKLLYRSSGADHDTAGGENSFIITAFHDPSGGIHTYKFWVVNEVNMYSETKVIEINFLSPSAVNEDHAAESPRVFTLHQNTPNPFNPATAISFSLAESKNMSLVVYDTLGRTVRTLANGPLPAGKHTIRWDGRDNSGRAVSSGVYICRMRAGAFEKSIKMTYVR